jgi:tRNA wybutosine-synthesizing protein 3
MPQPTQKVPSISHSKNKIINNFPNNKKTFLSKLDKSKKGDIDQRALPLITTINQRENYYTTSSCSGRVYLWTGSGKKNETLWINMSHDLIDESFLTPSKPHNSLIWLRFEPFIMHICCKDIESANHLLQEVHKFYKKSSILSIANKIILEIRSSESIEMPLYENNQLLFPKTHHTFLINMINQKMNEMWNKMEKLRVMIEKIN